MLLDEDRMAIAGSIIVELIQGARAEEEKENIPKWARGLHWLPVTNPLWFNAAEMSFALHRKGIATSPAILN